MKINRKNIIRNIINMLKDKWVKGNCRHVCWWCAFREMCFYEYGITEDETED